MASASSRGDSAVDNKIGPGRVIVIVGPSGAGKDTLIRLVRIALANRPGIVFARRIITRAADTAEDNLALSPEEFARLEAQGALAVSWSAHGLYYGYPTHIDGDIRQGATVVLNLSRMSVGAVRARYANTHVILIDADRDLRRARLLARDRETPANVDARMARETPFQHSDADSIIWNNTTAESAAHPLVRTITDEVC
jgi:ribose 1,5-bisphosphokinase